MASAQGPDRTGSDREVAGPAGLDETAAVRQVVERLLDGIGHRVRVQVRREPDGWFVDLYARRSRTLLGSRQTMTLNAVQYLTRLIIHRRLPDAPPIYLNVAGQREERASKLASKTVAIARLVVETGREMALDMVYEYEMKIVREALKQFPSLRAHAVDVGDELRRNVVITPAKR